MKRTLKRSRSGASFECPHCLKKLRGEKGFKAHLAALHPVDAPAPSPAIDDRDQFLAQRECQGVSADVAAQEWDEQKAVQS